MGFLIGLLLGIGLVLAAWSISQRQREIAGVAKPEKTAPPQRKDWSQTKNFLYYDGTVMPNSEEDAHEH